MNFSFIKKLLPRVEEVCWYLFLIALPFQTRHIFGFQPWGYVEWNAIVLYATDIIFGVLIVGWAWNKGVRFGKRNLLDFCAGLLIVATGLSVGHSTHQIVSLYQWIKLIEGIVLFWYVRHYAVQRFSLVRSLEVFLIGALMQAGIGIGQFMIQRDLGLWYLGESMLSPTMKGIASFYVSSTHKIIRAYGTTPHPNVLATYLALAIIGYWYWFMRIIKKNGMMWLSLAGYGVLIFGLLMTFSRTVIAAWALAAGILLILCIIKDRKRGMILAIATVLFVALFATMYWPEILARGTISADDEAVALRLYYGKQAFHVGAGGWNWTGTGIGNFVNWFMEHVPNMPLYLYQPVHNVYLLAYAETGILGATALALLLASTIWHFMHHRTSHTLVWGMVGACAGILLFVGIFDHFPWTLQQGRLLWWLVLGLVSSHIDSRSEA